MSVDIEDNSSLIVYLRGLKRIGPAEECSIELLTGGVSNKTVLLTRESGDQWVIKQALDKLRVKEDWYCDVERIIIEYKGMKWFSEALPKGAVPQPVFFDEKNHVFCMTAVLKPHENLKQLILHGDVRIELFRKLGHLLGTVQNAGRNSQEAISLFHDRQFFKDLRIEPYYQFTATQIPVTRTFYQSLIDRTLKVTETISHGDFSPKNVLVRDNDVVLLDFEVTHYGDSTFDVGFFLCQVFCFANHLQNVRQGMKNAALGFWNSYLETIGTVDSETEQRAVDHTIGCLMARVKGRSPVDFLTEGEQGRQIRIALESINEKISRIPELIEKFITNIEASRKD